MITSHDSKGFPALLSPASSRIPSGSASYFRLIVRVTFGLHKPCRLADVTTAKTATRFDLDGQPAEVLTEVHRAHAVETLREREKKDAERRRLEREAVAAERLRAEKLGQLVARFGRER